MLVLAAHWLSARSASAALLAATMALTGLARRGPQDEPAARARSRRSVSCAVVQHAMAERSRRRSRAALALGMVLWWWGAGCPRPLIVAAVVVPSRRWTGYSRGVSRHPLVGGALGLGSGASWPASIVLGHRPAGGAAPLCARRCADPMARSLAVVARAPGRPARQRARGRRSPPVRLRFDDRGPRHFPGAARADCSRRFRAAERRFGGDTSPTRPPRSLPTIPRRRLPPLLRTSATRCSVSTCSQSAWLWSQVRRDSSAALKSAGWTAAAVVTPKDLGAVLTGSGGAKVAPTYYDGAPDLVIKRTSTEHGKTPRRRCGNFP